MHSHLEDHEVARALRLIHQETQLYPTYPNDVRNSAFHDGLIVVKCFYILSVKCFYKNVNAAKS